MYKNVFYWLGLICCLTVGAASTLGQEESEMKRQIERVTVEPEVGYARYRPGPQEDVYTFSIYESNPRFGTIAIDPPMQSHLELVPEQIRAIDELRAKFSDELNRLVQSAESLNPRPPAESMKEQARAISTRFCSGIGNLLLEHQKEHLAVFPRLLMLQRIGISKFVVSGAGLTGDLKLTPEQKDGMQQKLVEMRDKLRQRLQQVEKEAILELVAELDTTQQKEIMKLVDHLPNQRIPDFKWFFKEGNCSSCEEGIVDSSRK